MYFPAQCSKGSFISKNKGEKKLPSPANVKQIGNLLVISQSNSYFL